MVFFTVKSGARMGALLGIVCLGLAAVGCGSSSSSTPSASHPAAKPSGTANVTYAVSLLYLNEKIVAPAFQSATGLKYSPGRPVHGAATGDSLRRDHPGRFIYMLELAQAQYHLPKDTVSKILGTSNFADPNSPQIYDEAALPAHRRPEHSARLLASR